MSDREFRAFLNLLMVSDPWPLHETEHTVLLGLADVEAANRDYRDWIDAYHHFEAEGQT